MKAVVRQGTRLVVDEVGEPEPVAQTVLVRRGACGVRGSDLDAFGHMEAVASAARRSSSPLDLDLVACGVCMEKESIEPVLAINKELQVRFVLGYSPAEFATTLGPLAEGRIDVPVLVTGSVSLDGVAAAFEELASPGSSAKIPVGA